MINQNIPKIYNHLLSVYGYQGWWPLVHTIDDPALISLADGYHPGQYDFPRTDVQKLEICLGAILTQNTRWLNVVKCLSSLAANKLFSIDHLLESRPGQLALAIKSVGYYNQKAKYLKNFAVFLSDHPFSELEDLPSADCRRMILDIKGIGQETADCILLYALRKTSFVVDAYTRRIFSKFDIVEPDASYQKIKVLCESSLPDDLPMFQEFHALLVKHGKRFYSKKPHGVGDFLLNEHPFQRGPI